MNAITRFFQFWEPWIYTRTHSKNFLEAQLWQQLCSSELYPLLCWYQWLCYLVVLVWSNLTFIIWLEAFLETWYGFFSHSSKKYFTFQRLYDMLIENGNKLLKNVKQDPNYHIVSYETCYGRVLTFDCKDIGWYFEAQLYC
jgi:hypothetical protein